MRVQVWKNGPLRLRLIAYISINYLQFRLSILFMLSPILETLAALCVVLFL